MIPATLGYPDFAHELAMAKSIGERDRLDQVEPVMEREQLLDMQREIHQIYMKDEIYQYIVRLITATRNHPYLQRGASPRATIALVKMAKASAWLKGRDFVSPGDVQEQFAYVVAHRIDLNQAAKMGNVSKQEVMGEILKDTKRPPMGEKR